MNVKKLLRAIYSNLPILRELLLIQRSLVRISNQLQAFGSTITAIKEKETRRERHRDPRYADLKRLLSFAYQVCSQQGEDGMISEIFRRIQTGNRTFVEVGVGNGSENNTAFLLSTGWSGYWIDGNSEYLTTINSRPDLDQGCLKSLVAFATQENIAELFAKLGVPVEFDLLSLDVDQNTFYLWRGLSHFRPRVVVVEYNATVPPDVDWKVIYASDRVWDGTQNFGASLKAFEILGREFGYSLVGCDPSGVNAFFIRNDLVGQHFSDPFTAENHYEPPCYSAAVRGGHPPAILDRYPSSL